MKVLSRILDIDASHGAINFHPKCRRVNLTHLSFVDDLLIFVKGSTDSVLGVKARQPQIRYLRVPLDDLRGRKKALAINSGIVWHWKNGWFVGSRTMLRSNSS
ncbi:hypothetical protein J1N35_035422 [Gossypium stocksii]|uniref:Reverse transcriptase domain-containing protein n=1 Tax=Gossypium stocksii TaxID=47602 RepID=A0A9D3UTW8_9ROSI|nr:hypothetical protein J1N35_035422 [Gossypium stocksii]